MKTVGGKNKNEYAAIVAFDEKTVFGQTSGRSTYRGQARGEFEILLSLWLLEKGYAVR